MRKLWTKEEKRLLDMLWGTASIANIAARIGRRPSAILRKAYQLGMKVTPQGYESIDQASKRSGFKRGALLKILQSNNVPIFSPKEAPRTWQFVEPDLVDAAIAKWGTTEIVSSAARVRGMIPMTLRLWLIQAGYRPPKRRRGVPWRLPSATIDSVIRMHTKSWAKRSRH